MKHFDKKKMATFENKFLKGAAENGCNKEEAKTIWDKLEKFSGYGFNRSHSTAYSIMAYWSQWIKLYYPLELYTVGFNFAKDTERSGIISEINKRKIGIKISPPDVNYSEFGFTCDNKTNAIYWSLTGVKGLGIAAGTKIITERKEGKFKSLVDFITRMKGTGVGRNIVEALICAGAFDIIEKIQFPKDRKELLVELYSIHKLELPKVYEEQQYFKSYNWLILQKKIVGYGLIDYKKILMNKNKNFGISFVEPDDFLQMKGSYKSVCVAGQLISVIKRKSKRGEFANLKLLCNDETILATLWNDVWSVNKKVIEETKNQVGLMAVTGKVKLDNYHNCNVLYSDRMITKILTF